MNKIESLNNVYKYILSDESLIVELRMGKGLDINKYETLKNSIKVLIETLKDDDTIPKKLALCFVDISGFFYYDVGKYTAEEIEQFEDIGHELSQLANELFA